MSDTIPEPVLDRMEMIRIAGYVSEEKLEIAKRHLLPATKESHGVKEEFMDLQPRAIEMLIQDYAREAGVRELRKLLEKIVRKVALGIVRTEENERQLTVITPENLQKYVGRPPHMSDRLFPEGTPPGVSTGLAWTSLGGKTLMIEVRGAQPNSKSKSETRDESETKDETADKSNGSGSGPHLKITGKLGKVMGESTSISLTFARKFMRELDESNTYLEEATMHMNLPEGGTPKDGPSAGIAMTSALLSLAMQQSIKRDVSMTGEMTLTGKVLRVGGIKEKSIAARRENINTIVFPRSNHADYLELKPNIRAGLTAHFVDHYDDVFRLIFDGSDVPMPKGSRGTPILSVVTPLEPVVEVSTQACA